MPGAVVSAVAAVYVSVPRWRVLRGWIAGFGAAGAGAVHVHYKIDNGQLQIKAGQMPTLSNTAKLVTIDGVAKQGPGNDGDCGCRG